MMSMTPRRTGRDVGNGAVNHAMGIYYGRGHVDRCDPVSNATS